MLKRSLNNMRVHVPHSFQRGSGLDEGGVLAGRMEDLQKRLDALKEKRQGLDRKVGVGNDDLSKHEFVRNVGKWNYTQIVERKENELDRYKREFLEERARKEAFYLTPEGKEEGEREYKERADRKAYFEDFEKKYAKEINAYINRGRKKTVTKTEAKTRVPEKKEKKAPTGLAKWQAHLKAYREANPGISYKQAQKDAKASYVKDVPEKKREKKARPEKKAEFKHAKEEDAPEMKAEKKAPTGLARWNAHVRAYKLANPGITHKQAVKDAKASYNKKEPEKKQEKAEKDSKEEKKTKAKTKAKAEAKAKAKAEAKEAKAKAKAEAKAKANELYLEEKEKEAQKEAESIKRYRLQEQERKERRVLSALKKSQGIGPSPAEEKAKAEAEAKAEKKSSVLANEYMEANKKYFDSHEPGYLEDVPQEGMPRGSKFSSAYTKNKKHRIIVDAWNGPYIGLAIFQSPLRSSILKFVNDKNNKNHAIVDAGFDSFFKSYGNDVIEKYGVDVFVQGMKRIAEYFKVKRYGLSYGTQSSTTLGSFLNLYNKNLVASRNLELFNTVGDKLLKQFNERR